MACDSAFLELASRNPFVQDLHELGYDADFVGGYFVLYGLPYLDQAGALQYGDLFSPVTLGAEYVIEPAGTHQVWWRGGRPHAMGGIELAISPTAAGVQIVPDVVTDLAFSLKLLDDNHQRRNYVSFQEKISAICPSSAIGSIAASTWLPWCRGSSSLPRARRR